MSQIILGTANFGREYGVANKGKLFSSEEAMGLIRWAQTIGINHFDTALAYGVSNEILGAYLDQSLGPIVDTKLDEKSCQSRDLIVNTVKETMKKLRVNQLSVLYLHNEELLMGSLAPEISIGLKEVLKLGLAKKIGVSVYSEAAVIACKKVLPELSVFQVPENICDRRLISSMSIQKLAENGNSFMIRSIFLQGLLLMEPTLIPQELELAKVNVRELNNFANKNSLSVMNLCVAYANSISWASGIVIGVASLNQLKEIRASSSALPAGWEAAISTLPAEIVDPRNWSL
jgi:aryl-alcohol dehydrogenase-like predicted oxidoreductase